MNRVFLDANVLYSNTARSLLIWLHINGAVDVFWSMEVWEEGFAAYARTHDAAIADRFRSAMTRNAIASYPSCMVQLPTFKAIGLKDPDDEHVVAAAIECTADYLVTNDETLLSENLTKFDLAAIRPDDVMMDLTKTARLSVIQSVHDHISNLPISRPSLASYMQSLRKAGLEKFADWTEQQRKAKKLFAEVW